MKKYEPIKIKVTEFDSDVFVLGESREWETDKIAPSVFGDFE